MRPASTLRIASLGLLFAAAACSSASAPGVAEHSGSTRQALATPTYDHVFLVINENHNFSQIIGNSAAPIINALAADYGLATQYTGVSDPSEPNYVAMLGGTDFGISSDDPYFFPGHTVSAENLMSQLDGAGKSWRAYFQDLPYAGYRGYCFPGKCNGIPDSDTQYVAKHNGIVNFANMHTPENWAKQKPLAQLEEDLESGDVPNFGYVVADECHDMHGAPPWCVDSGNPGDVDDIWLVSQGDAFVGKIVNRITGSEFWREGNNAIVLTWDEGDTPTDLVTTIVVTSHGPRGVQDPTAYSHYSLLATLQDNFGLACLANSCGANLMTPLFEVTGASDVPVLPAPFSPAPDGTDTVVPTGAPTAGDTVSLKGKGWNVVPSPSIGDFDNVLAAVAAASSHDAWAVGAFYPPSGNGNVLNALGLHFDGTRWTAYPLPEVGPNENSLLGVSMLPSGKAWAVGYFVDAAYKQRTLVEHFDGADWDVVPSPNPGQRQNIVYGVTALSDSDVWAVGGTQDDADLWHTLAIHWNGSAWSVVPTPDPGTTGNLLYAVTAVSSTSVYAVGQQADTGFPGKALIQHWDGTDWDIVPTATDLGGTDMPLGVTATASMVTTVGDRESSTAQYTTFVAAGTTSDVDGVTTPNHGAGENDLFGAATASDGTTWAAGWVIDPSTGNHLTLVLHGAGGKWDLVPSPSPNPANGDDGLSSVTAVPDGGLWSVGIQTNADGNYATLVLHHD
jgi:Phosphoesterase family